jgi:hypothetical protein
MTESEINILDRTSPLIVIIASYLERPGFDPDFRDRLSTLSGDITVLM